MRLRWIAIAALIILTPAWTAAQVEATTPGELAAMQRATASAERQASSEIESLFSRLCPGRCELIEVRAHAAPPRYLGEVTPGFGGEGTSGAIDVGVERLEARVMLDSNLPRTFAQSVPRMLERRLSRLAPSVVVTPELLEFPTPQAAPLPEMERPEEPEPAPEPEPTPEPEPELDAEPEPEPRPEPSWARELWEAILPALPFALLLALAALLAWAWRLGGARGAEERDGEQARRGARASERGEAPDLAALRRDLGASRAVQNEVLRAWIQQDAESVAILAHLVGPEILDDLKADHALRPALAEVSAAAAARTEGPRPTEAGRVAREARARRGAARVLHAPDGLEGDWEFVEGLSLGALRRVFAGLDPAEHAFAIGQLAAPLRAAYLESLMPEERRALFVDAGSDRVLSREAAIELAGALRRRASEMAHLGGEAAGQAEVVVELVRAVDVGEQHATLADLARRRPELARAVMSRFVLETAALIAPPDALADAFYRTPIESLSALARGTREDVRAALIDRAPAEVRAALEQELSLGARVTRAEYLEGRQAFTEALASVLQRNGVDLAALNARAASVDHAETGRGA